MKTASVLDIGGTFIKHARFIDGKLDQCSLQSTPARADEDASCVLDSIASCIGQTDLACLCMPGPMEYATGKSLMKHKFPALYGIEIRTELEKCTQVPCVISHDVVSFLAGVMHLGETANSANPAAITLGTGLGYAHARQGVIQVNDLGSPAHPLWNEPWQDGIAEGYVSARALENHFKRRTGESCSAREIALRANEGNIEARQVFHDMGCVLGELLEKRRHEDGFDAIILGGQVSRSAALFLPGMQSKLQVPVRVSKYLQDAALYGAYAMAISIADKLQRQ